MKLFPLVVFSILILAACNSPDNTQSNAHEGPKWQVEVQDTAELSGSIVVATGGGPYKVYRLGGGNQGVSIRLRSGSDTHSISVNDKATALSCNGITSLELKDDVHAVFDGTVKCGDKADLPVHGTFTVRR